MLLLVSLFGGGGSAWAQTTAVTFNNDVRYSQWIMDSRLPDFKGNTNQMGFPIYKTDGTVKTSASTWSSKNTGKNAKNDYVAGLVAKAAIENAIYHGAFDWSKSYFRAVKWYTENIDAIPTSGGSLDNLNPAKMHFGLYTAANSSNFSSIAGSVASNAQTQLGNALKGLEYYNTNYAFGTTNYSITSVDGKDVTGGWFHKHESDATKSYDNEMWCDGQYMGPALLAQLIANKSTLGLAENAVLNWDIVAKQFTITWNQLWNETDGLLYHAFTGDRTTSISHGWSLDDGVYHSKAYWGRAVGWYMLGLVDVLEQMPSGNANYATLKGYLNKLAVGVARYQTVNGVWYQVMDEKNSALTGNYEEASCSAIFAAAYLKGARLNLFTDNYQTVATNAYQGVIRQFMKFDNSDKAKVHLVNSCASAGLGGTAKRSGTREYYVNQSGDAKKITDYTEGKPLGAFIMAATEYEQLYQNGQNLKFTSDLAPAYTCNGTTDALKAEAMGGNTVPTYQWYKDSQAIPSATSSSYIPTESGNYYCVATGGNTIQTSTAEVTVSSAPTPSADMWTVAACSYNSTSKGYEVQGVGTYYKSTSGGTSPSIPTEDNSATWSAGTKCTGTITSIYFSPAKNITGLKLYVVGTSNRSWTSASTATSLNGEYTTLTQNTEYTVTSSSSNSNFVPNGEYTTVTLNYTNPVEADKYLCYTFSGNVKLYGVELITAPTTPEITIATHPQGGSSVEFAAATAMTVVASASNGSTCTYQWQSADSENGTYTNISNATSASYTVGNNGVSDKWYHCVVSAEGCDPKTTNNVRYQVTGGSSTVSSLVKIESNYTYTPDAALPAKTMTSDSKILAVDGGSNYVNGFGLSFKTGRQIAFKVAAGATVTANLYNNGSDARTAVLATSAGHSSDAVVSQVVPNTDSRKAILTFTPTTDATYYLCGASDLYLQSLNISFGAPQSSETTPTAVEGGTISGTVITATEIAAANANTSQSVTLTLPAGASIIAVSGASASFEGNVVSYIAPAAGGSDVVTITIKAEDGTTQDYTMNVSTAQVSAGSDIVSDEGNITATTTLSNSDKTCTWTNIGVTAKIEKGTSSSGHGLAMTANSGYGIDAASTLVTFKNVEKLYVRVPSASSAGTINITSSGSSNDRKYTTKSGTDIVMKNGSGTTVNFTSADIVKIGNNYYIELSNSGRTDYKATSITVALTSDETYKAKVLTPNTLEVTSANPINLVTIGGTSTITSTSNSDAVKTYSSSNESVATVNESGVVTATGTGTATITVHQDANTTYSTKDVEVTVNVTIGSTEKNSVFNTCHSASYAVGTNQSREFTFTNHGNKNQNYYNWVLLVNSATSNESALINLFPQVYKDGSASAEAQTLWKIDTEGVLTEMGVGDWSQFGSDMQNSTVTVQTSFSGNIFYMYATMVSPYGRTYIYPYQQSITDNSVNVKFTVEQSYIDEFIAGEPEDAYQVSVKSNNETLGTASMKNKVGYAIPNGTAVSAGSEITFVADKVGENDFANWSDETSTNPYVKTIEETTSLTANFQEHVTRTTYSYTVKAVDGSNNELKTIATGTYTTGDPAVTVAYPQYVLNGTTLYKIKNNTSGDYYRVTFTPDEDNYVYTLKYNNGTVDNVTGYVEAEDIEGFTKVAYTNRASNGSVGHSSTAAKTISLTPGTYKIFARGLNGNSATRTATFKIGGQAVWEFAIVQGTNVTGNSDYFSVDANTDLYVSSEGSSSSGLDWFYVQKINALSVTENGEKFGFTKTNVDTYDYATANGVSVSSSTTRDDVTGVFYNIKNSSNYVEVTETGAIAFTVYAYHGNSKDTRNVNVYVDGEKVGSVAVTPGGVTSSVFAIPAPKTDIHTIKLTGAGSDVYVADVVFYTEKVAPSVTPANVSVSVHQQKQFAISAPAGCNITGMNSVASNEYADVTYTDGKMTVTGKKPGNVTATFNVTSENELFNDGTATVHITVTKAELIMKYNPDSKVYEKNDDKVIPDGLAIEYYVIEDGEEKELSSAPSLNLTYATDDETVANVTNAGVISLTGTGGSANITASFAGNDSYTTAKASFSVTVKAGYEYKVSGADGTAGPSLDNDTRKFTVKNGDDILVYGTFGGWKRGTNAEHNNHTSLGASKADGWQALATYDNAIDGYSKYTSGINDAQDEDMDPSANVIYGVTRKGWFESPVTSINNEGKMVIPENPTLSPYSLPVRGTYMTFEPTKNGLLTVYILQNGAWNSSKKDIKDDDGFLVSVDENGNAVAFPGMAPWQFRPHSFYVTDQNGMPVEVYTDFKINTKQPIQSGIITQEKLDLKDSKGKPLYTDAQKQAVYNYCEQYGVKLGDKFKCILDPTVDGYYDATNIGNWKEFKQYMSDAEQKRVAAAWNTGVNGAEQVVKLDNGSYLAVDECIMKYSFHVAAGQTYYLFSNFSKMGFSGCNFIPDETGGAQPTATLALKEKEPYVKPTLYKTAGQENNVKNISVPQYQQISLDRTFTKDVWNTIYLPFVMTEKEVRDVFGEGTQLILLNGATIDSEGVLNLQFIYHEIQAIIAGYPYLIKPAQNVSSTNIKVYNKIIDPNVKEMKLAFGDYQGVGTEGFSKSGDSRNGVLNENNSTYYSAMLSAGDIYVSGGKLYMASDKPVFSNGYRSYIKHTGSTNAKAIKMSVFGGNFSEDGTATAIDIVELSDEAAETLGISKTVKGVYNLNGQKMTESVDRLPAGMYIVNGKKMYVK